MGISSFAENAKKEARRQSISFEDELVEGNTQKPDLFFLFQMVNLILMPNNLLTFPL